MKQGLLAFQYEQEKGSMGMTGLSGLMTYVELMQAGGLRSSVERHVCLGGEISYHVGGVKLYHSSRLDPRCCCS